MESREIWRDIPGLEGLYRASSFGDIFSVRSGRCLKWRRTGQMGYYSVQIARKTCYIHHLVLLTFTGPRPEGMQVCHNDGNPRNNKLDNLRYDTCSNNHLDKRNHGTSAGYGTYKKSCPRGHGYTGVNSQGRRICRHCERARQRIENMSREQIDRRNELTRIRNTERYANDPEYRDRLLAKNRAYYRKRKDG